MHFCVLLFLFYFYYCTLSLMKEGNVDENSFARSNIGRIYLVIKSMLNLITI